MLIVRLFSFQVFLEFYATLKFWKTIKTSNSGDKFFLFSSNRVELGLTNKNFESAPRRFGALDGNSDNNSKISINYKKKNSMNSTHVHGCHSRWKEFFFLLSNKEQAWQFSILHFQISFIWALFLEFKIKNIQIDLIILNAVRPKTNFNSLQFIEINLEFTSAMTRATDKALGACHNLGIVLLKNRRDSTAILLLTHRSSGLNITAINFLSFKHSLASIC